MRTLVLMTALLLAFVFGKSAPPASASDGLYWGVNESTGCLYLGDGTVSYIAACPRSDGWFDMYEANSGQWVYRGLGYWDANSCFSFWDGGDIVYTSCPGATQQDATTTSTMGGDSVLYPDVTITNSTVGTGYATIGGSGYSTGNATIDAINNAYTYYNNSIWLQPSCVYIEGDTCYVN